MTATQLKRQTAELAQEPPPTERATCPKCGGRIAVRREHGQRILEYHHNPADYTRWCGGSDMNLDEDQGEQ